MKKSRQGQLDDLRKLFKQRGVKKLRKTDKAKGITWRGKVLHTPVVIQNNYTMQVNKLTQHMVQETKDQVRRLFQTEAAQRHVHYMNHSHDVGMDAMPNFGSQARVLMNHLKRSFDQLFGKLAMGLSPKLAEDVDRASATGVHGSVKDAPNLREEGAKLQISVNTLDAPTKSILNAASAASTSFIKSIPDKYLNDVQAAVYDSITKGNGIADLIPYLDKQGSKVENWAHNTAMDQTRKVYNGLNAGRMRKVGIQRGEWIHSGGSQHPRELHEDFDGQTFDLARGAPVGDDGGNYVMPGEEPNCRCTFAPVVVFDEDLEDN